MGLIPCGFRGSFKTSEFYGTVGIMALVLLVCRPLSALIPSVGICFLAASYNLSRALYKRNRGIYSPAFKSGEWVLTMAAHAFVTIAVLAMGLDRAYAVGLIVATQAIYNVGRGIAKGVGVKTQTIMR